MSISKKELLERVAMKLPHSDKIIEEIVDATLEEIYLALKNQESVNFRNFGTFYINRKRDGTVFKFNPSQRLRHLFGWASTHED
jgi:DNA-binding protein HU-beta